jgi:hypothetical protein
MIVSSMPYDIDQHMRQSSFSANMQPVYNLTMYFIWNEPRDDDPDPNNPVGMEIIKKECCNIIVILGSFA